MSSSLTIDPPRTRVRILLVEDEPATRQLVSRALADEGFDIVSAAGAKMIPIEVGHRPRRSGRSNYGVHDRLWVGIVDLLGVTWLQRRVGTAEIEVRSRHLHASELQQGFVLYSRLHE